MIKKCIFVFSYLRIFLFISYFCVFGNLHLLDSVLFLDPTSEVELWYYLWIEWTEEMKIFWAHTVLVWIPLLYLAGTLPISICGLFTDSQNTIINSDGDHSIPFHVCSVYRFLLWVLLPLLALLCGWDSPQFHLWSVYRVLDWNSLACCCRQKSEINAEEEEESELAVRIFGNLVQSIFCTNRGKN